jgi:hypothetical protein
MRLYAKQILLLGAANTATAYLRISWVNSIVELMTNELSSSVNYNGPDTDPKSAIEKSLLQQVLEFGHPPEKPGPPDGPPDEAPGEPPAADPYWLEHIVHQGVAAFNEDPGGYQVYRNVKDFGAKGTFKLKI